MTQQEFQDRYQFNIKTDKIGGGSFGTVYKAYDTVLDREVAIKISEVKHVCDKEFSLLEEYKAIESLPANTYIANYEDVFRFESFNGEYDYGVMQYYPLGNLSHYLKTNNLSQEKRERLVKDILKGIAFLHKSKVVHRDLKPSNILVVDRKGQLIPKITDFGLSKQASADAKGSRFTNSFAGGTLQYSSPEQIKGLPLKLNTDLWSFGAIAYEILTGNTLFETESNSTATAEWQKEITNMILHEDITAKLNGLKPEWQNAIAACLEREVNHRAKNTDELLKIINGEISLKTEQKPKIKTEATDKDTIIKGAQTEPRQTHKESALSPKKGNRSTNSQKQKANSVSPTSINKKIKWLKPALIVVSILMISFFGYKLFSDEEEDKEFKTITLNFEPDQTELTDEMKALLDRFVDYKDSHPNEKFSIILFDDQVDEVGDFSTYDRRINLTNYIENKNISLNNFELVELKKINNILHKYVSDISNSNNENYKEIKTYKLGEEYMKGVPKIVIRPYEVKDSILITLHHKLERSKDAERFVDNNTTKTEEVDVKKNDSLNERNSVIKKDDKKRQKQEQSKEDELWKSIKRKNTKTAYKNYIKQYPNGKYVSEAKKWIKQIDDNEAEQALAEADKKAWNIAKRSNTLETYNSYITNYSNGNYIVQAKDAIKRIKENKKPKIDIVNIRGGSFIMGCTNEQGDDCYSDEEPSHKVTLSSFKLSRYEITNEEFSVFLNESNIAKSEIKKYINISKSSLELIDNKYKPKTNKDYHPVRVTWYGAKAFSDWIGGRLPTEAEWEFAARGGNKSKGYKYSGSNTIISYGRPRKESYRVGTKKPNELGLFDMSGNVAEWCADWFDENYYHISPENNPKGPSRGTGRVVRDGNYVLAPRHFRVSERNGSDPEGVYNYANCGFRVAFN